ncbi:MAG: type II toxin-antitoxin system RelE/ParE family toxin [Desulfuromonadales bacterium]
MRVRWTEGADGNLDQVEEYIAQDNPPAAVATLNKIIDAARMLADYPAIGKRGRERGTRELVVAGLPFIIIYVVQPEELVILRVLHTSMKYK